MSTPDPAIVAAIYNLDPDTIADPVPTQLDGTPATPEQIEALTRARLGDMRAVADLHRLALEQAEYELDCKQRIAALAEKYGRHDKETLGVIEARMTPEDRAEWQRLWDGLGNIMVMKP